MDQAGGSMPQKVRVMWSMWIDSYYICAAILALIGPGSLVRGLLSPFTSTSNPPQNHRVLHSLGARFAIFKERNLPNDLIVLEDRASQRNS